MLGKNYVLDIGINRLEVDLEGNDDFWYSGRVIDQGDLSTYYGYETFDATHYTVKAGKVAPQLLLEADQLNASRAIELLRNGYSYVRMKKIPIELPASPFPIHLLSESYQIPDFNLGVGINPTFFLEKNGVIEYAVINGFLLDLKSGKGNFKNAMIYR